MKDSREVQPQKQSGSTSRVGLFSPTTTSSTRNLNYETYLQKIEGLLSGIDVDRLAALIDKSRKGVEEAHNRDLILIVGRTGAGKSTTLNYLMGSRLEVIDDGGLDSSLQVASGETVYAEIGTDDNSTTLHPQVVPTREYSSELAYCDCTGFDDTRTQEEHLCSGVGVPLAISYARGVRGLMLVIDCGDFASKSKGLISLVNTMLQLLKDPSELVSKENVFVKNMLYVFTRVPAGMDLDRVITTLEKKKRSIETQITEKTERANEYEAVLAQLTGQQARFAQAQTNEEKQAVLTTIFGRISFLSGAPAASAKNKVDSLMRTNQERAQLINQVIFVQMMINNRANCFIVRGNEHDDKTQILDKVREFRRAPSIPKEHFSLDGRKAGPALLLEKIIEKIVEEGAQIFCEDDRTQTEASSLKKYIELVEKESEGVTSLLEKMRGLSKFTQAEYDEPSALITHNDTLQSFVEKYLSAQSSQIAQYEEELEYLDSSEPMRYKHRNLEPVTFESRFGASIAVEASIGLLIGMGGFVLGMAATAVTAGMAPDAVGDIWVATDNIKEDVKEWLLYKAHTFQYNDVPFLNVAIKRAVLRGNEYVDIPHKSYMGNLDLSAQVNEPGNGVYSITCANNTRSRLRDTTFYVWVELEVERRIHPDVRSRISLIKSELRLSESEVTKALREDAQTADILMKEDAATLANLSYAEAVAIPTVTEILKKRFNRYQERLQTLRHTLTAFGRHHENVQSRLQTQHSRFELVKHLLKVITINNRYVIEIVRQYDAQVNVQGQMVARSVSGLTSEANTERQQLTHITSPVVMMTGRDDAAMPQSANDGSLLAPINPSATSTSGVLSAVIQSDDAALKSDLSPQDLFLNDTKEKILSHVDKYLLIKTSVKRDKYRQNVASSLDIIFERGEFRQVLLNQYCDIPEQNIPRLREKAEYLIALITYDAAQIQEMYQPVKQDTGHSNQLAFAQNVAAYIERCWSALVVVADITGETAEEKRMLEAIQARMGDYFRHYKPSLSADTYSVTGKNQRRLASVLDSLRLGVFEDTQRRAEILGVSRSIHDIPGGEQKDLCLLNIIKFDEQKVEALYKLAMGVPQGPHSQFATDVVKYIKDSWQPLLPKKMIFHAKAVIPDHSVLFATDSGIRHQDKIRQVDQKMTVFKSAFIHFIEKTYRLFYVLLNEEVQTTKENAMEKVSSIIRSTEITTGVNIPFVGGIEINIPSVVAGVIDLFVMVDNYLDKKRMKRWCDVFPEDETQRFNAITEAALKIAVELSLELYHMPDMSVTVLAELTVKRVIFYATSHEQNAYSEYPGYLERLRTSLPYANQTTTPMKRKPVIELCQIGMRTSMGHTEHSKLSQHVGAHDSPTYQAILDHSGWVVVQEDRPYTFVKPKFDASAFCVKQGPVDKNVEFREPGIIPKRLRSILDVCVEVYQAEINNAEPIIPANIFSHRRQQAASAAKQTTGDTENLSKSGCS